MQDNRADLATLYFILKNANAALVFEFAYRFIQLGRSYFGKLDEESVKNNFVYVEQLIRLVQQLTSLLRRAD